MDVVIAVVRPKQLTTISRDFHTATYEVLLTDIRLPGQEKKTIKQFPKTIISFEEEPADLLCTFIYNLTGGEFGGLKGKRAVFVPPSRAEPVDYADNVQKGALYCITVDSRDKLNPEYVDILSSTPGFYTLDQVVESMNSGKVAFTKLTKTLLIRLESWLHEKHNVPGAVDLLFSSCAEDRLKRSVTNPAYFTEPAFNSSTYSGSASIESFKIVSRRVANEALAKMMSIEKCDKTIQNPLFGSDLCYKNQVDRVVINKYFGLGKPDYSLISNRVPNNASHHSAKRNHQHWNDDYPLHKAASDGNCKKVKELIKDGMDITKQDKDGWLPIHYAAWYGHLEVVSILLTEGGSSPNVTNANLATPLHIAASNGRCYVAKLLLQDSEIDVAPVDINGKTPLDLCSEVEKSDWQDTAKLLQDALNRPAQPIQLHLMDGSHRTVKLLSGANTTVQQLHMQMVRELTLPESCGRLFTVWICSRTLQLQLKADHKPLHHLNDWKNTIIPQLTDQDPKKEDPQLFFRRDATCVQCLNDERKIKNPQSIQLLFHEAYHHYIKSLYPCAEQDVLILGGILMQLNNGDYEPCKCRNYFNSDKSLNSLVPTAKLRSRNSNWASRITAQYKHYSQTMGNRDRSPVTNRVPTTVYVGVNDIGIHIINSSNKAMLQSFSYKDIEYSVKEQQPVLEIRLKSNTPSRGGMAILTKQAGMISNLMKKLDKSITTNS